MAPWSKRNATSFQKRKKVLDAQLDQTRATIAARKLEAASYNERIATQNTLLEQIQTEVEKIRKLSKRGLVSDERLNRLIREQLAAQAQILQTRSLLRQSEVSISESKEKLITLTLGRKFETAQSLRDLKDRITSLEATIEGELSILDTTDDGQLRSVEPDNVGYRFAIYRDDALLDETIELDTPIRPGRHTGGHAQVTRTGRGAIA